MIKNLINRTKTEGFQSSGRLYLNELIGKYNNSKTIEFNFTLDEEELGFTGKLINIEQWKLTTHQTVCFKGIFSNLYIPFLNLELLEEHPLLWKYNKPQIELELTNLPKNLSKFIGELYLELEEITGGWISVNSIFRKLNKHRINNKEITISLSAPLKELVEIYCKKHKIKIKNEIINNEDEKRIITNAKLLIFGNEFVSPSYINANQPYIIANEFQAKRI